jgi:hypothetical protein
VDVAVAVGVEDGTDVLVGAGLVVTSAPQEEIRLAETKRAERRGMIRGLGNILDANRAMGWKSALAQV